MILYDLRCAAGHTFETWFRNGKAYDLQCAAGEIVCPICGGTDIAKAPMAPRIGKSRAEDSPEQTTARAAYDQLAKLRVEIESTCDYVGDAFAEEARRIHYGEIDNHNIYGNATETQVEELREEGVAFGRIPWLPRANA
ncbi:MAG: DUF1178 family protein [Azospirillaceae bacterium]|nr:DUF1178 family protein [Azospirillaceae bacterium]